MISRKQTNPLTPRSENTTSTVSNINEKVKLLLRIRPFLPSEDPQQFITLIEENVIQIKKMGLASMMKFNYVQMENLHSHEDSHSNSQKGQVKMYAYIQETVASLFEGTDGTIFAYGQTGAGKTYSIVGDCPENYETSLDFRPYLIDENRGIMIRAIQEIVTTSRKRRDCRITISFFQIYNEKIFDLLSSSPKPLEVREVKAGEISIPGLIKIQVIEIKQALNCIAEGLKNRVTCSTSGNIKSSRSHSIFHIKCERLKIDKKTNEHQIVVSNLRIVDLAGSQKFNIPRDLPAAEREIRLTELKSINGSLSKLGHCISALTSQNRTHIPFRDSKLTRILRQSLLGSSKIRLIVCVSPSVSAMNQTASTLQFADSVKKAIFGRPLSPTPEKKRMIEYSQYQAVLQQLQKEKTLRMQLERIYQTLDSKPSELQLIRQNDRLRQQVTMMKEQLKVYQNNSKIAGLSISRSKSRGPANGDKTPSKVKRYQPAKSITDYKVNVTPSKVSSKSVMEIDRSYGEGGFDRDSIMYINSSQKNRKISNSKNTFQKVSPMNTKQSFENKIRKFMERSDDNDRQLEEKVKERLLQIRKEIVYNRDWAPGANNPNQYQNQLSDHQPSTDNLWEKANKYHK